MVLRRIHDDLDEAVAAAYDWPVDLPDKAILDPLVALNAQRAAEETQGHVRWLRPEYQAPEEVAAQREWADLAPEAEEVRATEERPWPETLPTQITAVRDLLAALPGPAAAAQCQPDSRLSHPAVAHPASCASS